MIPGIHRSPMPPPIAYSISETRVAAMPLKGSPMEDILKDRRMVKRLVGYTDMMVFDYVIFHCDRLLDVSVSVKAI